jgi:hypothetical protein
MRSICCLLLASAMPLLKIEASLAQELSVEDRACITSAVAKLPQVAALKIEGSRAIEGRNSGRSHSCDPFLNCPYGSVLDPYRRNALSPTPLRRLWLFDPTRARKLGDLGNVALHLCRSGREKSGLIRAHAVCALPCC